MHVAGVQADARTFEHIDPQLVGNSRDVLISELSGKGSVLSRAEGAGIELDADAAKRAVERIKEREHRGYHYEAADASFELLLRREAGELPAAVPARELPRDHREARRRQGRDRGDDQDLGRRASATCARPRATAPSTRSTGRCATRSASCIRTWPTIELTNYKVRILDAAPRHRRGDARAARLVRRPATRGARSASRRTSSRPPGRRWSTRSSTRSSRGSDPSRRRRRRAAPGRPRRRSPAELDAGLRYRCRRAGCGSHRPRRLGSSAHCSRSAWGCS